MPDEEQQELEPERPGSAKEDRRPMLAISSPARGLQLTDIDSYWRFAQYVARSGLAPKGLERPEAILIAVQMGAEVGLSPMAAIQNIAVINGRPSIWGDAMLAVCRASPVFDESGWREYYEGEGEKRCAICECKRVGSQHGMVSRFGVEEAKRAGLWGKSGPWQQYPDRMLRFRARGFALRDCFGDLLRGFYSTEEVADMPPVRHVDATVTNAKGRDDGAGQVDQLAKRLQRDAPEAPVPKQPLAEEAEAHKASRPARGKKAAQQGELLGSADANASLENS